MWSAVINLWNNSLSPSALNIKTTILIWAEAENQLERLNISDQIMDGGKLNV